MRNNSAGTSQTNCCCKAPAKFSPAWRSPDECGPPLGWTAHRGYPHPRTGRHANPGALPVWAHLSSSCRRLKSFRPNPTRRSMRPCRASRATTGSSLPAPTRCEPCANAWPSLTSSPANGSRPGLSPSEPPLRTRSKMPASKVDLIPGTRHRRIGCRFLARPGGGQRVLLSRGPVWLATSSRRSWPSTARRSTIVEAYRTAVPTDSLEKIQKLFGPEGKQPHAVTFTSSSTVQHFFRLLRDAGLPARS